MPGIFFTVAILIKPTALVFLPVLAVAYVQKFGVKKFFISSIVANIIFWISFLPFFKNNTSVVFPYVFYLHGILEAQSLPYVTNGAFNFWTLITNFKGIKDTTPFIFNIPYRYLGYLLVGLIYITVIAAVKSKNKTVLIFWSLFISSFSTFIFLTKMHERYSLIPIVFLLLATLTDRKQLKWFIVLTLISFFNHYHSWSVPKIKILSDLLSNHWIFLSLSFLNVALLFYFLRRLISKHEEALATTGQ